MELTISDVSCSLSSRSDTVYQLSDDNRTLARQIKDINSRIDDVLQRMIDLKADIDKASASTTSKFGGNNSGSSSSKYAMSGKKTNVSDTN